MSSHVQELVKDISAIDIERDRAALKNQQEASTADLNEEKFEKSRDGQSKAIDRAKSATESRKRKLVIETYYCHDNKNKFCIPIDFEQAKNLEHGFALERKLKAALKPKKKTNAPQGKQQY